MTKLKKSIVLIVGIVMIISLISGAFLYNYDLDETGGVSSTNEVKYDYVIDNSTSIFKSILPGAKNGSLKTIGGASYEYAETLIDIKLDINATGEGTICRTGSNYPIKFYAQYPCVIDIIGGETGGTYFLCWNEVLDSPSGSIVMESSLFLGSGSHFEIDQDDFGSEGRECWLKYFVAESNVNIKGLRVVVNHTIYQSQCTGVYGLGKNLIDLTNAKDMYGNPFIVEDGTVVLPGETDQVLCVSLNLHPGTYVLSCKSYSEEYDNENDIALIYTTKGYVEVEIGVPFTLNNNAIRLELYFKSSWYYPEFPLYCYDLQLELGSVATSYEPYQAPRKLIEIPDQVCTLPYYGLGNYDIYNYLDLENGCYVQTCKLVDDRIVPLDEPRIYDISVWLPAGSDSIDLYGLASLFFDNSYSQLIPSELSYRRVIN